MAWTDHPQSAEGFLYLLRPAVVFAARVNLAAASNPLPSTPYEGVTPGAMAHGAAGMTVLIGSTAGGYDRGRTYVRATGHAQGDVGTASELYIGYSSQGTTPGEVDLVDDSYITVVDLYEVWAWPSRMLASGVIRKNYDWDVNGNHPPILNIGGGLARIGLVTAGVLELSWDASGSATVEPGATWAGKTWDAKDGTITAGTAADDAITVEFPAGARWLKLDGTDSFASTALPRRQLVVALDGEDDGGLVLTAGKARWRAAAEGVTFSCEVRERLAPADVLPGTVALFLTRQITAGVETLVLSFAGYVDTQASSGSANELDFERGTTISCVDVAGRLAQLRGFPSQMIRAATSTNHNEMTDADLEKYLWWTVYWHSSAAMLADYVPGGTNYPFSSFSQAGGSLYVNADTLARAVARRLTQGADGVLRVRPDTLRLEAGDRTATVQKALTPADITRIERIGRARPKVGAQRLNAWLTSTVNLADRTTDQTQVFVLAPGAVDGQASGEGGGSSELAASELEARRRVGQDYARANNPEEILRIGLAHGNDGGLKPELLEWVTVTTDADTVGWLDEPLSAARCLLLAVEYALDDAGYFLEQALDAARAGGGGGGGRDPHPPATPGTQIFDPVLGPITATPTLGLVAGTRSIAFVADDGYLYVTTNFEAASPTWVRYALSISGTVGGFVVDAYSPLYLGTGIEVNGWIATTSGLYRITDIFGARTLTLQHTFSVAVAEPYNLQIDALFCRQNAVVCTLYYGSTGGHEGTWSAYTTDGSTWAEVQISAHYQSAALTINPPLWADSRGTGTFYATAFTASGSQNAATAALYESATGASWSAASTPTTPGLSGILGNALHVPYGRSDAAIYWTNYTYADLPDALSLRRSDGTSAVNVEPAGDHYGVGALRGLMTHPLDSSRAVLVGFESQSTAAIYTTSDANASPPTWTKRSVDLANGACYTSCNVAGDDLNTFFVWGFGGLVALSDDFGATISDKRGNIPADYPAAGRFLNLCGGG